MRDTSPKLPPHMIIALLMLGGGAGYLIFRDWMIAAAAAIGLMILACYEMIYFAPAWPKIRRSAHARRRYVFIAAPAYALLMLALTAYKLLLLPVAAEHIHWIWPLCAGTSVWCTAVGYLRFYLQKRLLA